MYLAEKNIKNLDVTGAFMHCPFGEVTSDCPFIKYHQLNNPEEQIEALHSLPKDELGNLRLFHTNCIKERSKKEKYPDYFL